MKIEIEDVLERMSSPSTRMGKKITIIQAGCLYVDREDRGQLLEISIGGEKLTLLVDDLARVVTALK